MNRDLTNLTRSRYDLLIIGGGIYGACAAWEASSRGLTVALVEKADFGSGTSANSLKVIHGGLRYLQHADFKRARQSIRERTTLMRIAPHLIHPFPILIPTYGHGLKGREAFFLGLMINDLISFDRNRLPDPQKHIPRGRVVSREECLRLLPGIDRENLTGGAIFFDAQVYNSERLPLSFLKSATSAGADLANYVEVTGFIKNQDRVAGVEVKDRLTGEQFDIRARSVLNTAGPWLHTVLNLLDERSASSGVRLAKAINLVTRPLFEVGGVGIASRKNYQDTDALLNKGNRFFFAAPWRGQSLIGTDYKVYDGNPDNLEVTEADIQSFLDEINQAYPPAALKYEDVSFVHSGLVPITRVDPKTNSIQLAKHFEIYDHRQTGIKGLISVMGVKYTTARDVARQTIDRIYEMQDQKPPETTSANTPLYGGHLEQFETFLQDVMAKRPHNLGEKLIRRLVYNHGSAYPEVLRYLNPDTNGGQRLSEDRLVLKAEILHGIRQEMAQKVTDILFRRTELGTVNYPGDDCLRFCGEVMGAELGWDQARIQQELDEAKRVFAWSKK